MTFEGSYFIHGQNASTQSTCQRLFPPHLKLSRPLSRVFLGIVELWLLVLFCLGSPSWAQYRYDTWTADSGLPQNIIRGICQTPDGYLWIATLDGLARFDGVHFTV